MSYSGPQAYSASPWWAELSPLPVFCCCEMPCFRGGFPLATTGGGIANPLAIQKSCLSLEGNHTQVHTDKLHHGETTAEEHGLEKPRARNAVLETIVLSLAHNLELLLQESEMLGWEGPSRWVTQPRENEFSEGYRRRATVGRWLVPAGMLLLASHFLSSCSLHWADGAAFAQFATEPCRRLPTYLSIQSENSIPCHRSANTCVRYPACPDN